MRSFLSTSLAASFRLFDEEFAATARLTVASISDSTICAMQKGGLDSLSIDEIDTMVGLAIAKSKELRKAL